ncbi:MAG: c-type cytochrome [Ignavibacteriaceae bacterium]
MKIKILFYIFLITILISGFILTGFISKSVVIQNNSNKIKLPDNPIEGRFVFEQKGCINCHAINGSGGKTATDLGEKVFFGNDYNLIADMWNHSSKMFKQMEEKNINKQEFNAKDFRSLRLFLYDLRYLGKSGNTNSGKKLFVKMGCTNCHSIGKPTSNKIRLDKTGIYASPVYLAQTMWNHAIKMQAMQKSSNIKVPIFKDDEFADLSSYIRAVSVYKSKDIKYMAPGNPSNGKKIFSDKGCFFCHNEKHIGPDLTKIDLNKSVTEIAGMMWNHSLEMEPAMQKFKIAMPAFKGNEMADLISYLYFSNKQKINGSAEIGQRILSEKGCTNCHVSGNSYKSTDSKLIGPFNNKDEFFSDLWNHLPLMQKNLYFKGKTLPNLLPSDIKSLYLYFNRERNHK